MIQFYTTTQAGCCRVFLCHFRHRITTLVFFVLLSLSLQFVHTQTVNAKPTEKLNLVFILADDLGWSDTTLYGTTSFYETPNIERLAKRGMLFTNAYTAHPLCSPTRSSIMTGLEPGRTGFISAAGHVQGVNFDKNLLFPARPDQKVRVPRSVSRLDTKYTTLAESIKSAGYITGHFGKWHLGKQPYSPLEHGFDVDVPHWSGPGPAGSYVAPWRFPDELDFDPTVPNEHIEDRMANEACAFIEKNKDKPFFLNYWAFSVHGPWDGKPELKAKYAKKADPNNPQRLPVYGAMVESLDDAVGQLLDTLDRLNLTEKTIIVFFSDNGGNMYSEVDGLPPTSNAPLRDGKASIYEGGSRVPCAVIWPGKTTAGSKTDAFLSSTDWYPTLIEMMKIQKPANLQFDGVSQVPAILGKSGPRESVVCFVPCYFPKPNTIPSTYVRRGPWKLIRFHGDGEAGPQQDRFELYNLDSDIGETKNLASDNPQLVKQLNAEITEYLNRVEATVPTPNSAYNPNAKATQKPMVKRPAKAINREAQFKQRDTNKDGFVTLKEFIGNPKNRNVPALTKQFELKDKDNDERLTLAELKGQK
ncbi:MAG: N-acetylgalactosamine 6-sulfate sulfatase [Blastopirellula sp.]|nr:MAG: N-acetylgalactosamine 6-sulfate sulfatase [Blastopirellula sp.]